jgi:hypothetical protein
MIHDKKASSVGRGIQPWESGGVARLPLLLLDLKTFLQLKIILNFGNLIPIRELNIGRQDGLRPPFETLSLP